jgi:hypothetical protein
MSEEEYENEGWGDSGSGSGDDRSEGEIEIENAFYEGEGCMKEDPKKALEKFDLVIEKEKNRECQFGFKAVS